MPPLTPTPTERVFKDERRLWVGPCEGYPHEGSVVLLHGYGSSGEEMHDVAVFLAKKLLTVRVVVPTAGIDSDTEMTSWWNLKRETPIAAVPAVASLLEEERAKGVEKLAVVGFSQGGALALSTFASGEAAPLRCAICIAGWFFTNQEMKERFPRENAAPALILHGEADTVVKVKSGRNAAEKLRQMHFTDVRLRTYPSLGHHITAEQLSYCADFLQESLGTRRRSHL